MEYKKKIELSIKLLQSIPQDCTIELCYSGGKDSDVILELAKMAGIPFEAIYKNTTIDPPGTLQHCREMGVTIVQPKKPFLKLVEEMGLPTRFRRHCCGYLKEYKIHDRAILGIRREESAKRAERYKEPEVCREYSKTEKVRQYFPILNWTLEDVSRFIQERKIKCAPVYYDENGIFHVERRLGCLGCPLKTDIAADFKQYPQLLKAEIRAAKKYMETNRPHSWISNFGEDVNPYTVMLFHIFFKTIDEFNMATGNGGGELFPGMELDYKKYLEDYFGIDLTI